jgi:uncharacterized membrane protein YeiH
MPINVLDAIGLSVFAVIGASKALTASGSGSGLRSSWALSPPWAAARSATRLSDRFRLHGELYAIPALVAAAITVGTIQAGVYGLPAALVAAGVCFLIRMLGVGFRLNAPRPPGAGADPGTSDNS